MTQVSIHNNVDIKAYVDVLHSPKSLDDEALKVSLYKPSATVVEHEIATFGRDAKGQFFTLNLAGAEIDELGSWDLVVRANEGTIFQTEKTLEAFDVVLTGGNTDTVVLSVLLGQKPCGCACQGSDPAEDTPSCPGKGCSLTVDTSWPETLSDDHVPSSKLVRQTLDTHTVPFTVERLGSYLYKASYQAYPQYDPAYDTIVPAGCSSFVRDGKLYRNFDWTYTDSPEFLVVASGFTGMALLPGVHDADTLNAQTVGQAPYHLVDGANDAGIRVSTHVVTNDFGISYIGGSYPSTRFVHDVLTHVDTLEDLAEFVGNLPLPSFPAALVNEGYVTQWFITDGTSTFLYAPDAQTRSYVLTDISARPQLTNFKWVDADTLERNDAALQSHPTGVERWNEISDGASLQDLAFTKAYTTQDRLSEFIGLRGTDKNSTDSELEAIQVDAAAIYARGQRDGLTWQTMHSIVYAGNHIESLYTQEDYTRNYTAQGGANIELKTINGQSLIGSGNIEIQGSVQIDTSWPSTLSNSKVPSTRLVKNSLNAKLDAAEALTTYTSLTDFAAGMATKLDATEAASTYATKQELPVVPTNVGAFTNDAGYLTEHQSLKTINNMSIIGTGNIEIQGGEGGGIADAPDSGNYVRTLGGWVSADSRYATQTALVDYETSSHAASTYATKSEIPAVPTKVSDLTNDTGFITSSALSDYETSAHAASTYATQSSLSVYETSSHAAGTYATQAALAAKADAADIPTKTSDLTNDSGFLTEHQSLADYATTASVTSGLAGKQDTLVAGTGISIAADGKTISSTQELFFAEFGVTTRTAVRAAVSAGKLVVCDYNNSRYYFTIDNGSQIYYATTPSGTVGRIYTITQNSDTNWTSGQLVPQLTSDRISSTGTTTPSDEKYFSALRVKNELDAKQDTLIAGTGISIAADGKTISATGGGSTPAESNTGLFNKILCIGDSWTHGVFDYYVEGDEDPHGVALNQYSYPTQLAAMLGRRVKNMGDAGKTAEEWYTIHGEESTKGYDAVIIFLGINDASRGVDAADTQAALTNIAEKVQAENEDNLKVFFVSLPKYLISQGTHEDTNDAIIYAADAVGGEYLDITTTDIQRTDYHPDAVGYHQLAVAIDNAISAKIAEQPTIYQMFTMTSDPGGNADSGTDLQDNLNNVNQTAYADVDLQAHPQGYIDPDTHEFVGDEMYWCSGYVYIKGLNSIEYKYRCYQESSIPLAFFDANKQFMSDISHTPVNSGVSGVIDLTGSAYADAAYVVLCSYGPQYYAPYLKLRGKFDFGSMVFKTDFHTVCGTNLFDAAHPVLATMDNRGTVTASEWGITTPRIQIPAGTTNIYFKNFSVDSDYRFGAWYNASGEFITAMAPGSGDFFKAVPSGATSFQVCVFNGNGEAPETSDYNTVMISTTDTPYEPFHERIDTAYGTKFKAETLSGATAGRPASPDTGDCYFDTTLSKPVWYTGSGWVDATGTSV